MGVVEQEEEEEEDEQNSLSYPNTSMMLGTMSIPITSTTVLSDWKSKGRLLERTDSIKCCSESQMRINMVKRT